MSNGDYYGRADFACLRPDDRNMFMEIMNFIEAIVSGIKKMINARPKKSPGKNH